MTEVSAAADRVVEELSKEADEPLTVDLHPDRTRETMTPGFSRMRTEWNGPDSLVVQSVVEIINVRILQNFGDAYRIMNDLYGIVRESEINHQTGEFVVDKHGWPVWKRNEYGGYIEDYSLLTARQKEDFLLQITARLFEWTQRTGDIWAEAMFAKAQWEEAMAVGFTEAEGARTVEDRTQRGRIESRDHRYHAVFLSAYSKKADSLVRIMELIGQRLKDALA